VIVNRQQLADILGRSLVTVDAYRKNGMPAKKSGREWAFDTGVCIQFLIDQDREGSQEDRIKDLDIRERVASTTMKELVLGEKSAVLIHVDEVAELVETEYAIVKSRLQAIPGRMAQALSVESDATVIQALLKQEVSEALEEISKHDAGFVLNTDEADA
jgi:phage terminase Nu1 subunit (DNA packaging protein)